ncbi:MAG: hypothetical protein HC808_03880 [Candidatus Competibacteraceae bacterium]|nr:hypothetical protein [Candidatus Competibacteraceae bacterium]
MLKFFSSCLFTVLLMSPSIGSAQTLALPDFGDPSRQYLSSQEERRLGCRWCAVYATAAYSWTMCY